LLLIGFYRGEGLLSAVLGSFGFVTVNASVTSWTHVGSIWCRQIFTPSTTDTSVQ